MPRLEALVSHIETIIHRDVGRGMDPVFAATAGGLLRAASAVAGGPAPRVGLITGFFVPGGVPPAAETDGPAGAALLAYALVRAGLSCRVATDVECRSACHAAVHAAGVTGVPIDALSPGASADELVGDWRREKIDWVIAIERCGPGLDGCARNMRGTDITGHVAALDRLFTAGPWRTIAIGDGGNEIGMGNVPRSLVAEHVPLGELIGCTVPADHLVAAGVSHWGAYAILAALALLRPDWSPAMLCALDPALDQAVVEALVRDGPAVDGVTLRREPTIDALPFDVHRSVLDAIRQAMEAGRDYLTMR